MKKDYACLPKFKICCEAHEGIREFTRMNSFVNWFGVNELKLIFLRPSSGFESRCRLVFNTINNDRNLLNIL
jgi:hypothetical protein